MSKASARVSFQVAREIQEHGYVFVIAEAGVNHNGELAKALALVDAAADAGADAVKFQTFKAEQVVTEKGKMAEYQEKNLGTSESQRDMLRKFELDEQFYAPIVQRCKERNILFLSTPHGGKESVDFLEQFDLAMWKIGSGDLTNYILLERVARTGKPIVLSTGMATLDEVKKAVKFIKSHGNNQIVVLHCTTNYPCPPEEVNLAAMQTMMDELEEPVGYSDHTLGSQVAIMMATLGAAMYECHFTLDKNLPGPDHVASSEPAELKQKIAAIRAVRMIMGDAVKKPNPSEQRSMIGLVRRSVVVYRDLPAGHKITADDLEAKRPGDGLSPTEYEKLIGKKLKKAMQQDEQITLKDVE